MSELSLEGKVAIVTGGGRGIGRALAHSLAAQGAAVVVNDLGADLHGVGADKSPAAEVVSEIEAQGGRACASSDSVAEWDGAQAIIERALDEFGRIDILVNNAGIVRDRMIFKMSEEEFDTVIRTHLYGSFFCIRAASPSLREQGSGRIINITSTSGLIGNFGQANYAAAKLGIVALTKIAALDLKSKNVTANCIAPWAMTRLLGEVPDEVQDKRGKKSRELVPEQIAPLVCYLASDAAQDVNGQIFCVRGREIILFSQPRPLRSIVGSEQWSVETLADAMPAFDPCYYDVTVTSDVLSYEPMS